MATGSKTPLFAKNTPGGILTITDQGFTTGDIFFVDGNKTGASDTAGFGTNPDAPFATIDFAVGQCTANVGDVIYVMPGHTEDISTSTSLVVDVAGVSILGLGSGTLRPRLTYTTAATATLSVTAANVFLKNLWLYADFTDGVTVGVTVAAGGDGFVFQDIEMEEAANTKEFLIALSIAAGCNDVTIDNFNFHGVLGGTGLSLIDFVGASHRSVVRNCYWHGDWSASVVDGLAAASIGIRYENILFYQDDAGAGLGIQEHSSSTGIFDSCRWLNKKDTVIGLAGALMAPNQCYGTNAVFVQGILEPVVDS